jgi:hypothetical protein
MNLRNVLTHGTFFVLGSVLIAALEYNGVIIGARPFTHQVVPGVAEDLTQDSLKAKVDQFKASCFVNGYVEHRINFVGVFIPKEIIENIQNETPGGYKGVMCYLSEYYNSSHTIDYNLIVMAALRPAETQSPSPTPHDYGRIYKIWKEDNYCPLKCELYQ